MSLGRTEKSVKLVAVRKKLLSSRHFWADRKLEHARDGIGYQPTASDSLWCSVGIRLHLAQRKTYKFMKPLTLVQAGERCRFP